METTNRLTWASVTDRYMYRKSLSSRFVTDLMESQTGTQTDRHKEQIRILLLNLFASTFIERCIMIYLQPNIANLTGVCCKLFVLLTTMTDSDWDG